MTKVRTCLWFDGKAEEAAELYTALVPNSGIQRIDRPGYGLPPVLVHFTLGGVPYTALNGGPGYPHGIAASIMVVTDDQSGTDRLWQAHLDAGSKAVRCGCMTDRFGLSWQIFPKDLHRVMFNQDVETCARVYAALQKMVKIDLPILELAQRGE